MPRLCLALLGALLLLLAPASARADDCLPSSAPGVEDLNRVLGALVGAGAEALRPGQQKDPAAARAQVLERLLEGDFDPTQPLPGDRWRSFTTFTEDCQDALAQGMRRAMRGGFRRLQQTLERLQEAYADCIKANFDDWFDANFPPGELGDLLNKARGALTPAQGKRSDLLRELMFAEAIVPGGHRQTGPTCTLNSLAMLLDHRAGAHDTEDQTSVSESMRDTTEQGGFLWLFENDCWEGEGDGEWGGGDWRDCVENLLSGMGVDFEVEDDWDDIVRVVQSGTPVLVTYYIKGQSLDAQAVPRGTEDSGYHASILEGVFTEDGVRYVIVKNPWDGWPQVWRESDFKESWSAGSYGLHLER